MQKSKATIVISGAEPAYALAQKLTDFHGRLIAVGVPSKPIKVDIMDMVLRHLSLIGKEYFHGLGPSGYFNTQSSNEPGHSTGTVGGSRFSCTLSCEAGCRGGYHSTQYLNNH